MKELERQCSYSRLSAEDYDNHDNLTLPCAWVKVIEHSGEPNDSELKTH